MNDEWHNVCAVPLQRLITEIFVFAYSNHIVVSTNILCTHSTAPRSHGPVISCSRFIVYMPLQLQITHQDTKSEMAARPLIDYAAMRSVMRTITNYKPYERCNHFSPETGN